MGANGVSLRNDTRVFYVECRRTHVSPSLQARRYWGAGYFRLFGPHLLPALIGSQVGYHDLVINLVVLVAIY